MLGQKALNYLRLGAVKDEPTRTGKLKQRQKRKMVEQFRKSGNLYAANTDFKHIKPTDVHPFFGTGVCLLIFIQTGKLPLRKIR